MSKTILVSLGGGFSSTAWMPRILLNMYPKDQLHFVTCVLPNEHPSMFDLYDAVEEKLDISITYIAYDKERKFQYVQREDRSNADKLWTPFKIFNEVHLLGNSRQDPCSRMLKRETMFNYINTVFGPESVLLTIGIHRDEIDRMASIYKNWKNNGYETIFPLLNLYPPSKEMQLKLLNYWYGVSLPLYELGFEHNNCHGACIKAGQRQWALLWYYYPEVYKEWEDNEKQWREQYGDYTILRKTINKERIYLTLEQFRIEYLEKALCSDKNDFLTRYIQELPGNPPCFYCSAI